MPRFLRPALAAAALPAIALLVSASTGVAPAKTTASPAKFHPHPLELVHGTKPNGITNAALGRDFTAYSHNWSGYVATGTWSGAQFRYVQATFTVPSLNCAVAPGNSTSPATVADWVGIDGVSYNFGKTSPSVEQDGIVGQCVNGAAQYAAWWENYPNAPTYPTLTINPGDAIEADVYYNPGRTATQGQYNYTLTDVTTGQGFNTPWEKCGTSSCANSSAEVITEAPTDGNTGLLLPLADYGLSNFENIAMTDKAGQRAGITSSNWKSTNVVMVDSTTGTRTLSAPGPLFGGAAFSDFWKAAS
jgi:hypothetical protein